MSEAFDKLIEIVIDRARFLEKHKTRECGNSLKVAKNKLMKEFEAAQPKWLPIETLDKEKYKEILVMYKYGVAEADVDIDGKFYPPYYGQDQNSAFEDVTHYQLMPKPLTE